MPPQFDISSMSQFLEGYLDRRDKVKEQQRRQQMQQMIQRGVQSGGLQPSYSLGPSGPTMTAKPQEKKTAKESYVSDIVTRMQSGQEVSPEEQKLAGAYVKPEDAVTSPYKGTAQWKQEDAQSTLFEEFLGTIKPEPEAWARRAFTTTPSEIVKAFRGEAPSKNLQRYMDDKGNVNVQNLLRDLGKTKEDFYQWAVTANPDLARIAFPGKTLLRK